HRYRDAQVGQVADAALGAVHVVVEEHVAGAHRRQWMVADDRMDERGVRAAGQLAQPAVVDTGPEVVRVADHRGPCGAPDRGLHLPLDRGERTVHDLDEHRISRHERVTTRLPSSSTRAVKPGCSGTVEPYSSTTAGPVTVSSAPSAARSQI